MVFPLENATSDTLKFLIHSSDITTCKNVNVYTWVGVNITFCYLCAVEGYFSVCFFSPQSAPSLRLTAKQSQ